VYKYIINYNRDKIKSRVVRNNILPRVPATRNKIYHDGFSSNVLEARHFSALTRS